MQPKATFKEALDDLIQEWKTRGAAIEDVIDALSTAQADLEGDVDDDDDDDGGEEVKAGETIPGSPVPKAPA